MTDSGNEPVERLVSAAGAVGDALSPLGRLGEAPVPEHVGVFEEVLAGLEAVLTSVDDPATVQQSPHGAPESGR